MDFLLSSKLKPTNDSLQSMAKGIPQDLIDNQIKSALEPQYPGFTHRCLAKDGQSLRPVNIQFSTLDIKNTVIDKGLLIDSFNKLFQIQPMCTRPSNYCQ